MNEFLNLEEIEFKYLRNTLTINRNSQREVRMPQ